MVRIQQQDKLLSIHSDWFSLLVPGVWETRPAQSPAVFHGAKGHRTLAVSTHTLPATPSAELRALVLRGVLDTYAKSEPGGAAIDEGPVETSPGGAIVTLAYSVEDRTRGALACAKLVCYGRRCVAVRLAADPTRDARETREALETDIETILDGLSILQFERVSVAQLQRRMNWLFALNLFLFCGALLVALQCYWGEQNIDLSSLRQKTVAIQDAESGRAAMRESVEFFDFWLDRAATFRKEIVFILACCGGIAAANLAAFWWLRRIVRHPWDDIVERE